MGISGAHVAQPQGREESTRPSKSASGEAGMAGGRGVLVEMRTLSRSHTWPHACAGTAPPFPRLHGDSRISEPLSYAMRPSV